MIIRGELSVTINGEEYFTVQQFARITGKLEGNIRHLIWKGNRIRKIISQNIGNKPFILASEVFDFPFVLPGRISSLGTAAERFVLRDGELYSMEEIIEE